MVSQSVIDAAIIVAGYALSIFGGGWLVDHLLEKVGLSKQVSPVAKYIGWFERFLIITFVLAEEMTAIGFVVASKSLLRFGESRQDKLFAECVLLGTLASVSIAIAAGIAIRYLVQMR